MALRRLHAYSRALWPACSRIKFCPHMQFQAGLQAAEAMQALHELAILHCDVSPTNIMRSASGVYKLTDFGISRTLHVTNSKGAFGNPWYLAPEQGGAGATEAGHPYATDRSDVWALAATLLEAWSGTLPYGRLSASQIYVRNCAKAAPPLDCPARPLPPPLLARCFDFDPTTRPSAAELRRLLHCAQVLPSAVFTGIVGHPRVAANALVSALCLATMRVAMCGHFLLRSPRMDHRPLSLSRFHRHMRVPGPAG
jgi:eukaryotic-like serine/threonine-protein kinase